MPNKYEFNKSGFTNQIYQIIKQKIINLEIKPGSQIDIKNIAKKYDISEAPVRDALKKLEEKNLVKTKPRVGSFAIKLTSEDIRELYGARKLLELHALREMINDIKDNDLEKIEKNTNLLLENGVPEGNKKEWFDKVDENLHKNFIVASTQNSYIQNFYEDIYDLVRISRHLQQRIEQAAKEHLVIIEGLKNHDLSKAEEALGSHLERTKKSALEAKNFDSW
ncbi:MAG: GntR family transcriptional regulator [Candidatus Acetothermia bacterium]